MEFYYEEDLEANPFFVKIMESHHALINEVGSSNWLILVPKRAQISAECLKSNEFLLSHVLLPSEDLPKTHFTSLYGETVTIDDKLIKVKNGRAAKPSLILFEEMFYTKDLQKFKILCIETPLCQKFIQSVPNTTSLVKNLEEAVELIKQCSAVNGYNGMRKIENAISNFNLRIQMASDYIKLKQNVKLLYEYCVNLICQKRNKLDPFLTMNLKVSIEYYLMDKIYEKIIDAISIEYSEENQKFNKIIQKLSDISIVDLNITPLPRVSENLNLMRMELAKINNCKCSLDKLYCIKNVIDTISSFSDAKLMTTDELLPVLVYAIVKTNFFHWIPTLNFIKEFNLSQMLGPENQSAGSVIFYILTTLEAVIYFIQTNENLTLTNHQLVVSKKINEISSLDDYMNHLFEYVKENNEIQVMKLINVSYSTFIARATSESSDDLCHPLCSCSNCTLKIEETLSNVNLKSRSGHTMLHIASAYNNPKMVSILMNQNGDVNATDANGWTPLHYSAQRGHQKVLFLLLHGKSNINAMTDSQQSPLLLASMNGHDCCVKALLYFSDHANLPIDLNSQDSDGNTALHHASRAGYDSIVEGLLEYKAKVTVKNNIGKFPLEYAYSSAIKNKLESAAKYQVEELPVNEKDFVFISNDDLADNKDDAC